MVRSFTDDPAAGRRFIVGMQTPANKGVLGFGMTPEEAQELRSQRIAGELGLAPEIAEASRYISPKQMAGLGVDSILGQQEEAARAQREEQTFQRQMEATRQKQAAAEAQKDQQVEFLMQAAKEQGNSWGGMSPVQREQFIRANPDEAMQFFTRNQYNIENEEKAAVREAGKKAQQKQLGETIAAGYDPEIRPHLEAMVEKGAGEKEVRARGGEMTKALQAQKKQEAEAAQLKAKALTNEALFAKDPEELIEYRGYIANNMDPDVAVKEVRKSKEAAIDKQKAAKMEERKALETAIARAKGDFDMLGIQIKDMQAEKDANIGDPTKEAAFDAEIAELREQRAVAGARYRELSKVSSGAGVGQSSPPEQPGAGTPTATPPGAAVPPPASGGQAAPPPPAGEVVEQEPAPQQTKSHEQDALSQYARRVLPDDTKEKVRAIATALKADPRKFERFKAEYQKALLHSQSDGERDHAMRELLARFGTHALEKAPGGPEVQEGTVNFLDSFVPGAPTMRKAAGFAGEVGGKAAAIPGVFLKAIMGGG